MEAAKLALGLPTPANELIVLIEGMMSLPELGRRTKNHDPPLSLFLSSCGRRVTQSFRVKGAPDVAEQGDQFGRALY